MTQFKIYWGNRLEKMAEKMFDSLYGEGVKFNPMIPRCIVTNSPVMNAWLKHYFVFEWPGRKGRVLANCDFELLYPFINDWMDCLLVDHEAKDTKRVAGDHPYSTTNMQWRIYRLISDGRLDSEIFSDISSYLGESTTPRRSFQLAGKLAAIFDEYQILRHDVICDWQETDSSEGGWQGELWRMLIEQNSNSYADLFSKMTPELISESYLKDRFNGKYRSVMVFGITAMPLPYIYFLKDIMGNVTNVEIFALNPEKGYWLEDVSHKKYDRLKGLLFPEAPELVDDPLYLPQKGHELLCSMGQSLQDYLISLYDSYESINDLFPDETEAGSLLQELQNEILNITEDNLSEEKLNRSDDDYSIQIQICHSARREVEVLHDHLLQWLTHENSKGEKRQPYRIQVMVVDMPKYAPHIDAVFSSAEKRSSKAVPYVIDARQSSAESEILSAFMSACNLVNSRFQLSTILDLLTNTAVLEAFKLKTEDMDIIEQLAKAGNIRWGLDADHREKITGVKIPQYMTWEYGLDRLLTGYATGEDEWHDSLYASDYAESHNAVVLGKLTAFISKLRFYADSIMHEDERTLTDWHSIFAEILDTFFVSTEDSYKEITRICKAIDGLNNIQGVDDKKIPFEVVTVHLEAALAGTTTGDNLLENSVVFCQLRPMNSRPADITCILGLNDGDFPRNDNRPKFDLLAETRRRGDRSIRNDDRCAFIEALTNARQKLYLSYTGRTDNGNEVIPPSIILQEVKDYLKGKCDLKEIQLIDGTKGLPFEVLHHLNSVHPDYFDESRHPELFSYSKPDLMAAKSLTENHSSSGRANNAVIADSSSEKSQQEIDLDELKAFFKNPAKYFYRNTMDIRLDMKKSLLPDNDEPSESNNLELYKLKATIIEEIISNGADSIDLKALTAIAEVEGYIPMGIAGSKAINDTFDQISEWMESDFKINRQTCCTVKDAVNFSNIEAVAADITIKNKISTIIRGSYNIFELPNVGLNIQLFYRDLCMDFSCFRLCSK